MRHIKALGKAMRYDSEHKSETRRRVLKEAAREIRAKGPGGVAVAGIMARAGLTHGGFYAHFDSKEALIAAAIETMFESARSRFDLTANDADPRMALLGYVDFYLSPQHRDLREIFNARDVQNQRIAGWSPFRCEDAPHGCRVQTVRAQPVNSLCRKRD